MSSTSLEALAMAGVDCVEWGMDAQEWELQQLHEPPLPHLLADAHDLLQEDYYSSAATTVVKNDVVHQGNGGGDDDSPSTDGEVDCFYGELGGSEIKREIYFSHKIHHCCLRFMITMLIVARGSVY
ncbi:unnamed protein product [Linum trigynum]|uniref:Uncharacterized protein n=1 Tax=Linum trigynum TaxID=586398 RepID=A0AAV2DVZ6_9ROSI